MVTRPQLCITVILLLQTWGPSSEQMVETRQKCPTTPALTLRRGGSSTQPQFLLFHQRSAGNFAAVGSLVMQRAVCLVQISSHPQVPPQNQLHRVMPMGFSFCKVTASNKGQCQLVQKS